jgi:putative nucleotidyltransferase with HDIG domain
MSSLLSKIWSLFTKKKPATTSSVASKEVRNAVLSSAYFEVDTGKCYGIPAALTKPVQTQQEVLKEFSKLLKDIPSLPPVWSEIQISIERGDSAKKVAFIIHQDQALATEILKAANSAGFNNTKEICDLDQAIVRLGLQAVRGIATHHCTSDFSRRWKSPFSIHELWKHSMAVSALSTITARYIPGCDAGIASTLGLLHDIGRMGLNSICQTPFHYPPEPDEGFLAYENEHFGCTHVDAGILLAKHWKLPETLQQGIRFHHHPGLGDIEGVPEEIRKEVLAVYLADFLAIHFGFAGGNKLLVEPHSSFAPLLKTCLNKVAHNKAVTKELWRIKTIEF